MPTFDEYIKNPQGKGSAVVSNRIMYQNMYTKQWDELKVRENGLIMYQLYKSDSDYYVHFKIPSGVNKNFYYDTVVQFYPDKSDLKMEKTLYNYQVRFYSNDPSFVYTFCYAFKSHKMFIKDLEYKMSKLALTQPAKIKNPKNELGYVKSIYFSYLECKSQGLFAKNKWEVVAKKYSKSVWNNTVDHADDKIRKSQELVSANRKVKQKAENAEKNKNKDFKKSATPVTSKFSPTIKNFGHFNSGPTKEFGKFVKKIKTSFVKDIKK